MHWLQKTLLSAIVFALLSSSALALKEPEKVDKSSWVALTGRVTSSEETRFTLDYGDGTLTVNLKDWASYNTHFELGTGDKVTVYGRVNKGLYESSSIDPASIFVEDLNSYFYATPTDEGEFGGWAIKTDYEPGQVVYIGTVESVSRVRGSFTLDTGDIELTVDTTNMLYDPLDDEGFQQIAVGDRVSVEGGIDDDFFGSNEMTADSVVTLDSADD